MENVIIAIFCIALILFGALTISEVALNSTNEIATAWRQMEETSAEISRTSIVALDETQCTGEIVEVTLRNAGEVKLGDFEDWDVILQYYSYGDAVEAFSDSFEPPVYLGNWVEDPLNPTWRASGQREWDGVRSAEADGNPLPASDTTLTMLNTIDFSPGSGWVPENLTFYWYIERGLDVGEYLAADVWDGDSWEEVERIEGVQPNGYPEDEWHYVEEDISSYTIADFQVRFRATMNGGGEDAFVDLVKITALPDIYVYNIKRLEYTEGSLGDNQWTVEGIYMDASTSDPEVFEKGIFNPDEEMVIQMQVDPIVRAASDNLVMVSTPNGISASDIFSGP